MANKNTKAKAFESTKTVQEYFDWYSAIKYNKPDYQREVDPKCAGEFFAHLIFLVLAFHKDYMPKLDTIQIRWANKKVLEILDGQHRSVVLCAIINNLVRVPNFTSNLMEMEICDKYRGYKFNDLPKSIRKAILSLVIPVVEYKCTDKVARAIFHAANAGRPLNTNDKTRNNYCDNPLYQAVEKAVKKEKLKPASEKTHSLRADGLRNMIYRCVDTSVNSYSSARVLNAAILKNHATADPAEVEVMVNGIVNRINNAYALLDGDTNQIHTAMGMYMYLESAPSEPAAIKEFSDCRDDALDVINDKILKEKFSFNDTPSAKYRSDRAKEIIEESVKEVTA